MTRDSVIRLLSDYPTPQAIVDAYNTGDLYLDQVEYALDLAFPLVEYRYCATSDLFSLT